MYFKVLSAHDGMKHHIEYLLKWKENDGSYYVVIFLDGVRVINLCKSIAKYITTLAQPV